MDAVTVVASEVRDHTVRQEGEQGVTVSRLGPWVWLGRWVWLGLWSRQNIFTYSL